MNNNFTPNLDYIPDYETLKKMYMQGCLGYNGYTPQAQPYMQKRYVLPDGQMKETPKLNEDEMEMLKNCIAIDEQVGMRNFLSNEFKNNPIDMSDYRPSWADGGDIR